MFYDIKNHPIVYVLLCLIIILTITLFIVIKCDSDLNLIRKVDDSKYSLQEKMNILRKDYETFSTISKDELQIRWIKLFSNCEYSLSGKIQDNEFDCSTAIWFYLWSFGCYVKNIDVKTVVHLLKKFQNLQKLNLIKQVTKYEDIRHTNIIIFNPIGTSWHTGMVFDKGNGYVCYMDVNARTGKPGYEAVRYGTSRIHSIWEISFAYFIGDLLIELDASKL